jgi:DNA-binding transcriptional ArsR family regulator
VVSRHLKVLEEAGIVQVQKQGRHRIYALDGAGFVRTLEEILTKAKSLTSICCPPLPKATPMGKRP